SVTDATRNIQWVNDDFTRITEYGAEEVINKKSLHFLFGEETNPVAIRLIQQKIIAARTFETEMITYTKSGRKCWLRIQGIPQFDEVGTLISFFALGTDITERKKNEEALRRTR